VCTDDYRRRRLGRSPRPLRAERGERLSALLRLVVRTAMAPPSKEEPPPTEYALEEIFKWYIKANEENGWALVRAQALYTWRRNVQARLLPVWKHETSLDGRRHFEQQMDLARVQLVRRGHDQSVDELVRLSFSPPRLVERAQLTPLFASGQPAFDMLRSWMLWSRIRLPFDPVADAAQTSSAAHSLAKGPLASISERTAARYGTTRRRWEADARERWAAEQGANSASKRS